MSSEEWLILHGRYERYAQPVFRKALREGYASTLTMIPLIDYTNYQRLISQSFNRVAMHRAYSKVYAKVGLSHGKRIQAELKAQKKFLPEGYDSIFLRSIYEWVQTNLGQRITDVNDYTIQLIQDLVQYAYEQNYSISQMRAYLQRQLNSPAFTRMRSLRIARTETTTAANLGAMKAAEQSSLLLDKEWIAVMDDRTRHDHLIENGQTAPLNESFTMADGSVMMQPGDPKAPAKQVINCRCTLGYVPRRDSDGLLIFKN